jgi:hypothetical protein
MVVVGFSGIEYGEFCERRYACGSWATMRQLR